jgi:hypothetical protein
MGLTALNQLTLFDQICLGLSGIAALLIGMKLLPTDNMAPIVQSPLLLVLLLLWYRHARTRALPVSAAEPAPQGE